MTGKFISEKQMQFLKQDLSTSRRHAYTTGTTKNLKIQWESYLMFCIYFGLSYLPATTEILCLYSQFLSKSMKSVQSIKKLFKWNQNIANVVRFFG